MRPSRKGQTAASVRTHCDRVVGPEGASGQRGHGRRLRSLRDAPTIAASRTCAICHEEDTVSVETILVWIAIGLVAGWLASGVVGGGYGVVGDIVLGIVGAFLGGLIFRALHLGTPFRGVASTIFVGDRKSTRL